MQEETDDEGTPIRRLELAGIVWAVPILLLKFLVWVFLIAIWVPVGGALWVSYLSREVAVFFLSTLNAALHLRAQSARGQHLHNAVIFFFWGLCVITWSVFLSYTPQEAVRRLGLRRIVMELVWATVFWIGGALVMVLFYRHLPTLETWAYTHIERIWNEVMSLASPTDL